MASGELNAYPPEVLILDFDGVVRHWHDAPVRAIELRHGLPLGTIVSTAHGVPEYERGVRGQATFDQWCRATARTLAAEYGSVAYAAVDEWRTYRGDLDQDVLASIVLISQTVPVALLSNAHDCLRADLAGFGIARHFAEVVCSAEEGVAKPEREIYLRTCRRLGVAPGRTVFIDDREVNVIGARSVGLRAEVFVNAQQLVAVAVAASA
jgi:putative hydrolase of the HAD superfamily